MDSKLVDAHSKRIEDLLVDWNLCLMPWDGGWRASKWVEPGFKLMEGFGKTPREAIINLANELA